MSRSTEDTAKLYVAASQEPDRAKRTEMLEACFAEDARQVTRGTEVRGRDAIIAGFNTFTEDPRGFSTRLITAIDVGRTIFRFAVAVESAAGAPAMEFYDVGEVDADGRITLLITFNGALPSA